MNLKPLLLVALLASPGAFAQTILIDDFTTGPATVGNADDSFESVSGYQTGSMLGGNRSEQILCYNYCDYPAYSSMTIGSGALSVDVPSGGHNTAQVIWGTSSSPLNVDFSRESGILLTFSAVSGPLEVESYLISNSGYSTYGSSALSPGTAIGAGAQTLFLPFSSFYGSATLSSVNEFELILGGGSYGVGDDASSASFTLTNVSAVPEPSNIVLLGGGLGALALFMLRRRRTLRFDLNPLSS
jgi:hypothetical protein